MKEAEENKKWYKKQRTWSLLMGLAALIASVIPGGQPVAAAIGGAAVLIFGKGTSDAVTRIENTTAKTERVAESNAARLDIVGPC